MLQWRKGYRAAMENDMASATQQRQLNIRIDPALYQALEAVARQEHRSLPQTAQQLLADGLSARFRPAASEQDDISSRDLAALAVAGGAFDWLADEPDVYDDTCGEPL